MEGFDDEYYMTAKASASKVRYRGVSFCHYDRSYFYIRSYGTYLSSMMWKVLLEMHNCKFKCHYYAIAHSPDVLKVLTDFLANKDLSDSVCTNC